MDRRKTRARMPKLVRNVTPDKLDLRDRPYLPTVALSPPANFRSGTKLPVLNQGDTSACTGFALATVVNHLLVRARRVKEADVSPFMLYSMARRYDEFPGSEDAGSSLRGALKGWYKHGACARRLWLGLEMPEASNKPGDDWWLDAVNRPLGAYYRVDPRSITDMHVALNEVGILYGSAICHDGWLDITKKDATIPFRKAAADDGGHAFAIVGYDQFGFRVHNSWDTNWGDGGFATLTYEDWLAHAMDCWVVQLGVVTEEHRRVAASPTPVLMKGTARLSSNETLRYHQLAPYVVDMENDGALSSSGAFRTNEDDVRALVSDYLDTARRDWGVKPGSPLDIAIYAHGGLTAEKDAAATFARWLPALYAAKKFPIFLMWESDLWTTISNQLAELVRGAPRPSGGPLESLQRWWNERLEGLLAPPGAALWDEMKENAAAITGDANAGGRILFRELQSSAVAQGHPLRLHLIGHSAGAIAHTFLVDRLAALEWEFATVNFLAPAVRVDRFEERLLPWLKEGKVKRFNHYQLTDAAEQQDPTCRTLLGYGRSLLYLVSRSFEGGSDVPILGMEKHFPAAVARMRSVKVFSAPSDTTRSTTHGGFDEDAATIASVIAGLH
ncbi:C1 family peptidase [Usitatibacter palustris]|uniref:Papain family cysteine protease n=1 Tax=Usitatibacter palustris TaxID=2732487 RepID=A0A6M4HB05_9PROT|nr:C1 family peptidase [Usitatibacter palustris]QJR15823.1 hypothetical protein DSM104440_02649 [Usitatibacter palustris]